jgi:hypothetical protein
MVYFETTPKTKKNNCQVDEEAPELKAGVR